LGILQGNDVSADHRQHRTRYKFTARKVKFLGGRDDSTPKGNGDPSTEYDEDDSLPF